MKKVAGSLKLLYSQYRELQAFSQFGSDLDADTKARLANGERIVEVLKQPQNTPISVEHQVMIIYAVVNGLLDDVKVSDIPDPAERPVQLYRHPFPGDHQEHSDHRQPR